MNLSQLQTKLLAAARRNQPGDHVPYAFEKRVMANIGRPVADIWAMWGKALWRGAAACVAAVMLAGLWSYGNQPAETTDLAQDFESAVYALVDAPVTLDEDSW